MNTREYSASAGALPESCLGTIHNCVQQGRAAHGLGRAKHNDKPPNQRVSADTSAQPRGHAIAGRLSHIPLQAAKCGYADSPDQGDEAREWRQEQGQEVGQSRMLERIARPVSVMHVQRTYQIGMEKCTYSATNRGYS